MISGGPFVTREQRATEPCRLSESSDHRAEAASILIVEDHAMLAEALGLALTDRGFNCVVAELRGQATVLEQAAHLRPDLALLDLGLDGADGLDLVSGLRAVGARVLVVTGSTDESRLASALALGASGWVSKAQPFERLLDAADSVVRGQSLLSAARYDEMIELGRARLADELESKQLMAQLTPRERQVLWALSKGETAEEIARAFFLSIGTVRTHIQGILGKLGVSSQLAAVAKARSLLSSADASRWAS